MCKGFWQNLNYDLKAIRKYGFIRHLYYLWDIDHTIVNLHFLLDRIPDLKQPVGYNLMEISLDDDAKMQEWAEVVRTAFGFDRGYDTQQARSYLLTHPYKDIKKVFLLYQQDTAVGAFFIGVFKNDTQVGCAGRFAVLPSQRNQGLGRLLILHALHELKKMGIKRYEEVFNYSKDYSIRLFMRCGGIPEFDPRYLVFKGTRKAFFARLYVKHKVKQMHKDIMIELYRPFTSYT